MYRTVTDVCLAAEAAAKEGRLSRALELIAEFVGDIISREATLGRVISSRDLDHACLGLGRGPACQSGDENPEQAVYILTAIYGVGGHTRVLLDLIGADRCKNVNVLLTNVHHDHSKDLIDATIESIGAPPHVKFEVAPAEDWADRMRWVQQRLCELRPGRTYLLQHNYDAVCIASAQPELVGQLIYIHHCDHSFALGNHIPHATHVDLSAGGFHRCREIEGIRQNVMWPMTADVPNHRAANPFRVGDTLRTCACGSYNKFGAAPYKEPIPYSIGYPEIVISILQARGGVHIHIGSLPEIMLDDIQARIARAGLSSECFVYVPQVPNLATALIDLEVDLYIGSIPYGGGRATIEAMGAGVPVLVHSNYRSEMFSTTAIAYDQAIVWRSLEDLARCLRALTDEDLRAHAQLARRYFEDNHTADALQKSMEAAFVRQDQVPPHRREYYPDQLQTYLDEYAAVAEFLHKDAALKEWSQRGHDLELLRASSLKAEALEKELNEQTSRLSREIDLRDEQVNRLSREIDLRNEQASRLSHEIDVRNAALQNRKDELASVYASRSWKITEPLRRLHDLAAGRGWKK